MPSAAAAGAGGCVNKAFDAVDDGFQTIDLRTNRHTQEPATTQGEPDPEPDCPDGPSAEDKSLRCGWGVFRPKWLQRFRTAKWALFWLCWAGAIQGMVVNGFVNVVITTIEKRFGLRSMQTGVIAGG
ncbi:hypothetical protein O0L34_g14852 [Tuta absoluta]|nr:hypothetical protein O0L34_g14852 [Tuta absoluta]